MSEDDLRAVVFVVSTSKKGTVRSAQEYESPLLVLTGTEYAAMPFQVLHDRLCSALRGTRPRLVMEVFGLIRPPRSCSKTGPGRRVHYLRPFAKIVLALAALREKKTALAKPEVNEKAGNEHAQMEPTLPFNHAPVLS